MKLILLLSHLRHNSERAKPFSGGTKCPLCPLLEKSLVPTYSLPNYWKSYVDYYPANYITSKILVVCNSLVQCAQATRSYATWACTPIETFSKNQLTSSTNVNSANLLSFTKFFLPNFHFIWYTVIWLILYIRYFYIA